MPVRQKNKMGPDKKSKKWLYYFIPILSLILVIGLILLIPGIRNNLTDRLTNLIFGPPQKNDIYDPEKDKEHAKMVILDFYHAYQELSLEKIIPLTKEPLTLWEVTHCRNLEKQDKGYKERNIALDNLIFEFKNFNKNEAEIYVNRLNVSKVPMPFKFGETTQGSMSFRLRKENDWKIVNRTYNTIWVSEAF